MPKISVIVPIYNSEKYLNDCLGSLMDQDFIDCEFICINDGSTDSSEHICKSFCSIDTRFKLINMKRSGPASARNQGLDIALGDYICFVDSDDILAPGALSIMYATASEKELDVLIHSASVLCDTGAIPRWIVDQIDIKPCFYVDFTSDLIFSKKGCRPFLWLHFIKRSLIEEKHLRMNESLFIGEDQAFEILYLSEAKRVCFIADKLYAYRVNRPNSIMTLYSNNPDVVVQQHILIVDTVLSRLSNIYQLEKPLIHWVLETIYQKMMSLPYVDGSYIKKMVVFFDLLNYREHYSGLSRKDRKQIKQILSMAKAVDS